jgi:hypothetical protein
MRGIEHLNRHSPFVPAKAGTQSYSLWPLVSRLRGNERSELHPLEFTPA